MKEYFIARHDRFFSTLFRTDESFEVYVMDSDLPDQLGRNLSTVALFVCKDEAEEYAARKNEGAV